MEGPDWLIVLNRGGLIEGVDGGAPSAWIGRRADDCQGISRGALAAARALQRDAAAPNASAAVRRIRVAADAAGPAYTLVAVEAVFIHPAEVPFAVLVAETLVPLTEQAESAGIDLRLDVDEGLPESVSIDASKLRWAVATLVGNALRYVRRATATTVGGTVRVHVHASGSGMVGITVEDDGPGIPGEVQRSLQARPPARGEPGAISLRLVHEVVAAHGGALVIKRGVAPEPQGTTITLWLPIRSS